MDLKQPGQKMAASELDKCFDRLYNSRIASAQKLERMKQQSIERELAECTFKPRTSWNARRVKAKMAPAPASVAVPGKKKNPPLGVNRSRKKMAMAAPQGDSSEEQQLQQQLQHKVQVVDAPKRQGAFMAALSSLQHFNLVLRELNVVSVHDDYVVSGISTRDVDDEKMAKSVNEEDSKMDVGDVFCSICREGASSAYEDVDDESDGGMIQLASCQHHAHVVCLQRQLQARWPGKKISFSYMQCGECRVPLAHDTLARHLTPHRMLRHEVEALCLQQAQADDLIADMETKLHTEPEDTTAQCMAALACYLCSHCQEPFCGGKVDCAHDDQLDVDSLKCPACAFSRPVNHGSGLKKAEAKREVVSAKEGKKKSYDWHGKCRAHGYKFAIYKCDSCCSVATWDCRSNHYCTRCHDQASSAKNYPCPGLRSCPLGILHPPNKPGVHGTVDDGFVIGCSMCFLQDGEEKREKIAGFELATDESSRRAVANWQSRF